MWFFLLGFHILTINLYLLDVGLICEETSVRNGAIQQFIESLRFNLFSRTTIHRIRTPEKLFQIRDWLYFGIVQSSIGNRIRIYRASARLFLFGSRYSSDSRANGIGQHKMPTTYGLMIGLCKCIAHTTLMSFVDQTKKKKKTMLIQCSVDIFQANFCFQLVIV